MLSVISIILAVANVILVIVLCTGVKRSPKVIISEDKQYRDYCRNIGAKDIKIQNVEKEHGSYSQNIVGTIENISNKNLTDIKIVYYLYDGDDFVGEATDYIDFLPAKKPQILNVMFIPKIITTNMSLHT